MVIKMNFKQEELSPNDAKLGTINPDSLSTSSYTTPVPTSYQSSTLRSLSPLKTKVFILN